MLRPVPWKVILRKGNAKFTYYGSQCEFIEFNEKYFIYEIYKQNPKKSLSWKSNQMPLF